MSTRSIIAKAEPDGTGKFVFVQQDGYPWPPHGVGHILRENYNTTEQADDLISLGHLQRVLPTLKATEKHQKNHVKYRKPGYCNRFQWREIGIPLLSNRRGVNRHRVCLSIHIRQMAHIQTQLEQRAQ